MINIQIIYFLLSLQFFYQYDINLIYLLLSSFFIEHSIKYRFIVQEFNIKSNTQEQKNPTLISLMKIHKNLTKILVQKNQQNKQYQYPVKCYLRFYQANGMANPLAIPPLNFQILDDNTLLQKNYQKIQSDGSVQTSGSQKYQYTMHTFNKIFSCKVSNNLMLKHTNFISDLNQGINHTHIILLTNDYKKHFIQGVYENNSMLIEYFLGVYFDNQNFNDDNTEKQHIRRNILFSMFSTINSKTNQYIDLLTGQRYTFLSKKDINTLSCKVFYEKKITNLQDFLIALKIALIRYQECCNEQLELIVYRISVEEEDIRLVSEVEQKQAQRKLKFSTGNVVICNLENKYTQHFIKNIESLLSNGGDNSKVSDHGQLFGYLQSYLKNGKLSLIKHVINQGSSIISQLPEIEFLTKSMMPLKSTYKCNSIKLTLNLFIKQLQINQANPSTKSPQLSINFYKPSFKLPSSFLFNKQSFGLFSKIVVHYKSFVQITKSKLQSIITLYNYIYYTITQFYEQQRFPISLQIKKAQDTNWMLKLYYISKIYSLSEKYQMENLEPVMEKIKTIKQQIIISLKSLYTDINLLDKDNEIEKNPSSYDIYASSKSTIRANSIHNNDNPFNKQEIIVKIFKPELDKIKKYLKYILNFNFRLITHEYDEKLQLTQNCNKQRPNKYLQEAVLFTKKTNLNNINLDNLLNINFVSFLEDVLKARQQNSSSPSNKQANTSISKLSNHSSLHTNLRDSSFNHDTSRNKNSEHQSYFLRPIQNLIKDQETIKSFEKVDYSLPRLNYNKKNKAALLNEKCLNSEVNLNKSLIKQHSQNGIKNYPHSLKKSLNSYHESINQKQNQKAVDSLNKILKKSIKIHLNNIKKDPQSIGDKVVKSTHSYSNDKSSFVDQKIEKYNFSIINISNDKELSLAIQKSFQQKRIRKEKRGEKISHSIGDTLLDKSQVRYIKRHKIIRNKVQQIKLPEIEIKKIC